MWKYLNRSADLYVRWKDASTLHMVVNLGLPFGVGWWEPSRLEAEKPRFRWRWGHEWAAL